VAMPASRSHDTCRPNGATRETVCSGRPVWRRSSEARNMRSVLELAAHGQTRVAPLGACPLCGREAYASDGTVEAYLSLLRCSSCRAFVIERQLLDVIVNARAKNLQPVLRHLTSLSQAAQSAAARGTVLIITSTNWIRVAMGQQRLEEQRTASSRPSYMRPHGGGGFHSAAAASPGRRP
jgi:hypothetical protein